jgi:hypothetical protein
MYNQARLQRISLLDLTFARRRNHLVFGY